MFSRNILEAMGILDEFYTFYNDIFGYIVFNDDDIKN